MNADGELLAVDLFAGCGGASQGLVQAGFTVVGAVELDADAAATYRLNHPDASLEEIDILDLDPADARTLWGLDDDDLDILKACPPCQGFSTLGASDPDDPRNDLISRVTDFIISLEPRAFVLENVPGIRDDRRLTAMMATVTELGYTVQSYDIDAQDAGVPQRRRRHIVLGVAGERDLPEDLLEFVADEFDCTRQTAHDALENAAAAADDDPLRRHRELAPKTLERIAAIPVNGNRFDLPEKLQLACHKKLKAKNSRSAAGPYGRVRAAEPAPTMTTRCTTAACGQFVHPTENRGLTLREAASIQTFPVTYRFAGTYGSIERQVGNAVPVKLAEFLGVSVNKLLTEDVA